MNKNKAYELFYELIEIRWSEQKMLIIIGNM